jgi:hypothetical protein
MRERADLTDWIRGELVGPARPISEAAKVQFEDREFSDPVPLRRGPLAWLPPNESDPQEVLYFDRESPHRKYGAGLLHPAWGAATNPPPGDAALQATDTVGVEPTDEDTEEGTAEEEPDSLEHGAASSADNSDDFEVTSPDVRHPSTMGVSFCVVLRKGGRLNIRIPQQRRFAWQAKDAAPFQVNGRYEACKRRWIDKEGHDRESPVWRRHPAVASSASITIDNSHFVSRQVIKRELPMPGGAPLRLRVEIFPRQIEDRTDAWLVTVVLRNSTEPRSSGERETVLYQTFFEVSVDAGHFESYPESRRPFGQLDPDEQSLALLYRDASTWAIGHGCAAGWDAGPEAAPELIYADVMPAVELPSMTPDIEVEGRPVQLSMREMAALSDDGIGPGWDSLQRLADGYAAWIHDRRVEAGNMPPHLAAVASRHLDACDACLARISAGLDLMKGSDRVRTAFRLANLSMLLQQISTKQLTRRPLTWNAASRVVLPQSPSRSPWTIYEQNQEGTPGIGYWRAFQIAFLVMSLDGAHSGTSASREIVDLIWFPTGGGKTEAYLALMAFYMFHERLLGPSADGMRRDGTNVLMRYTLRMLTTQQFQRAASLICAMEYIRRNHRKHDLPEIPGRRFSLGLWIGQEGSPNDIAQARNQLGEFRRGDVAGNPLVLTECPWCRSEIGRYSGSRSQSISKTKWNALATRGVADNPSEGPLLHCPDPQCEFGQENAEHWLPVEVIDERIYRYPPSLVIATVDKLAMVAYRPAAGALFGRRFVDGKPHQIALPPGLIVQDELHLISGPLGSMYALYEGIFERLCSFRHDNVWIKPKIVASTATIRGASEQVVTLYARPTTHLFPSPGLLMGDSFFGRYARTPTGKLAHGRMYLGIHASDYGSVLTTQVRAFSSALFRPWAFSPENRDPWWTLLTFYNSIRELGGAKTLFDSDIRSRLKFIFNRENFPHDDRRTLRIVEELTSRLSQADIVQMMDRLSSPYAPQANKETLDACLASNIIEVGVDIDRLSLMGVVGQPKTTATYIQVTGRVGRRWWERPGLILVIYNPSKSRDRSHFEQFHSYHRRLYERVEPTTATPFAISAIQRGLPGVLLAWARQHSQAAVQNHTAYAPSVSIASQLLNSRCTAVQIPADQTRSNVELDRVRDQILWKWQQNPQLWEDFPPNITGEYLMLWPGQFATPLQKSRGAVVPSSMRQVDRSAELTITQGYAAAAAARAGDQVGQGGQAVAGDAARTPDSI